MAITSGTHYVGPAEALTTWHLAVAEIHNQTLTGDVTFVQRGNITYAGSSTPFNVNIGAFDLVFTTEIPNFGSPSVGYKTVFTGTSSQTSLFRTSTVIGTGRIIFDGLNVRSIGDFIILISNTSNGLFGLHLRNILYECQSGQTLRQFALPNTYVHNVKGWSTVADFNFIGCTTGCLNDPSDFIVENCTAWGIGGQSQPFSFANITALGTKIVRNCYGFAAPALFSMAFEYGGMSGSNNASNDLTATGVGSLTGVSLGVFKSISSESPDFLNLNSSSVLAHAGVATSIPANVIGIRGNPRPHSGGFSIGADEITVESPATTTSSSPWVDENEPHEKVSDAKDFNPATRRGDASPNVSSPASVPDAKDFSPNIQYSDPSQSETKPSSGKDAEGYRLTGKKGLRTGFISVMPELDGYGAASPGLGTGYMMPFLNETLKIDKAFRDLDVVGHNRMTNQRRPMYTTPQGAVEFPIRSNDIVPILQSHFQKRIGTTPANGTTYYEFVPNKGRVELVGNQFGTGSFLDASSCHALSLSVFRDMAGTGVLFKTGVADKLTFKMHSVFEPTVLVDFQFREGTVMGTSPSHPYGTYSSLSEYSPTVCSVDFLGLPVLDFELTSNDNVELRNVVGDNRPIHKFGRYELKGKATVDLSKDSLKHYGSVLSGSSFSVSATMYNGETDRIVFQMPDCRMSDFPIGYSDIYAIPFQAFASDNGSVAPIKVGVWTQHYSATSFQPN